MLQIWKADANKKVKVQRIYWRAMPLKARGEGEAAKESFRPQCKFSTCENKEGRTADWAGGTPE